VRLNPSPNVFATLGTVLIVLAVVAVVVGSVIVGPWVAIGVVVVLSLEFIWRTLRVIATFRDNER
jgi:hypothetical protein